MRDHEVFNTPISIDRSQTITKPVPVSTWRDKLGVDEVEVLPLVDDHDGQYANGWCSYEAMLAEGPDIEFITGGINTKTPAAAGVWRQGHLMHFGFEQSPEELNDAGDALLINSIVYIARFTEDRAIVRAPSPFAGGGTRARSNLESWLKNEDYPLNFFESTLDAAVLESIKDRTREGYLTWLRANRKYLRPGAEGLMVFDEEARALGVTYDEAAFFTQAIDALRDESTRGDALTLLNRYVPEGPADGDAAAWAVWHDANGPYLFYSEWAGYRWYVDPLAKKRGVPTKDLRGPARADETPVAIGG